MSEASKGNLPDLFNAALRALHGNNFSEAETGFRRVLEREPSHIPALNLLTVVLMSFDRFAEAEPFIARAVALNKSSDVSFYNYGLIAMRLKKPQLAHEQFTLALALNRNVSQTWNNRGIVNNELGQHEEALSDFNAAIALDPGLAELYANKGKSLALLKRHNEAIDAFHQAIAINPDFAEAIVATGDVLVAQEKYGDALAAYDKATSISPGLAEAWAGRGTALYCMSKLDEASDAYSKALSIIPTFELAWLGRGNIHTARNEYEDALRAYDKALATMPDLESAWLGRGNVFYLLKQADKAFEAYDRALALNPDLERAWLGRANMLFDLRRYDDAYRAYDKCFTLKPDLISVEGHRLYSKLNCCNWSQWSTEQEALVNSLHAGKSACLPFVLLSIDASPEDQAQCANICIERSVSPTPYTAANKAGLEPVKIRVGYLSTDFRTHPVGYLTAGLFESHDRSRYETYAFSIGPNDGSELRKRIETSFYKFLDFHDRSDADLASAIRDNKIDILIDLVGHAQGARLSVLAQRPAPILAGYLGFAGTMGGGLLDYIVADGTVIPGASAGYYSEKIVRLPHSFMPHDQKGRAISEEVPIRQDEGLPEQGFVFCCFNNTHKINPSVFDSWMRILGRVEGSVIWLSNASDVAKSNLLGEASKRGIDSSRLVFSKFVPSSAVHLARHRLADLFLDTLPYNAHTTASDALWAGLPVLTCAGETYASRVAASLLNALDLSELITHSRDEYERLAVELALNRERLRCVREKLEQNRLSKPLFDTSLLTRHLEHAYEAMYERYRTGLPPDHIAVADDALKK